MLPPRWVRDWERLVQAMVDEPYRPPRLEPDTGALKGFLEASKVECLICLFLNPLIWGFSGLH